MNKEQIYVPIANKKEAKRAKAVLEAMGEGIRHDYWTNTVPIECTLDFRDNNNGTGWLLGSALEKTKITLKQLIELLVSEQKEPEKIAVRVDNEKEFNAIEKYRLLLGFDKSTGKGDMEFPLSMQIEKKWGHTHVSGENTYLKDYKIIPFSEFAKEHNLIVPILISEDCVELFEGDDMQLIYKLSQGYEWSLEEELKPVSIYKTVNKLLGEHKAFSTKKAALDWIEAQKPKEITYDIPNSKYSLAITKGEVSGFQRLSYLEFNDIKAIHKAMEELNNG